MAESGTRRVVWPVALLITRGLGESVPASPSTCSTLSIQTAFTVCACIAIITRPSVVRIYALSDFPVAGIVCALIAVVAVLLATCASISINYHWQNSTWASIRRIVYSITISVERGWSKREKPPPTVVVRPNNTDVPGSRREKLHCFVARASEPTLKNERQSASNVWCSSRCSDKAAARICQYPGWGHNFRLWEHSRLVRWTP